MDYKTYYFSSKEVAMILAESVGMSGLVAYLFYQSIWGGVVVFIITPILFWEQKKICCKNRIERLNVEFKECIHCAAGALMAGYSTENAFKQAGIELKKLYGKEAMIVRELDQIQYRLSRNETLERALQDFSKRSGSDDIESFTEVFSFAKRGGGDFVQIIQITSNRISDKIEVQQEISTVLAAKKMEQKVMCFIPLGILLFFQISSPQFLEKLYGNFMGVMIMTAALIIYAAAIKISLIIIDIEV